ncbi:MAG TPA: hypothetical protein VJZ78_00155 [Anaerolineales bacterium]|nr:hypothetical protein [Anaerolineales bacterium]
MTEKRNVGALVVGVILISLGALSLLERLFKGTSFWGWVWPIMIMGFGALFFVGMFIFGKSFSWMAIPGSIVTTNGIMLFLQNLTGRWETWSYSWTIILISVGLGIFIMGAWEGNLSRKKAGRKVMEIGLIMFVIFGAFFEIIFSFGVSEGWRTFMFPIALLILGSYLVFKQLGLNTRKDKIEQNQPDVVVPPPSPDAE